MTVAPAPLHEIDSPPTPAVADPAPRWLDVAAIALGFVAFVFGALERIWLLVHVPLFSDEAVVGLMARQINHGHFTTFFWGQQYGGVEPYLVALVTHVLPGVSGVNATAAILSGVAAIFVGLLVTELCGDRRAGILAGSLAWVWPYTLIWNSSRELGFHFATLALGMVMLYFAVRLAHGHRGIPTTVVLGLAAGAGWWSSPEIVYFAVPAAIVLIGSWSKWSSIRTVVLVLASAVVGALPWLWTNARDGFKSLSRSAAPVAVPASYGERLSVFFHKTLPIDLGVKTLFTGEWVGGPTLGKMLFAAALVVIVGALVASVWLFATTRRGFTTLACAAGVVAFPFVLAANPGTAYWIDGRYGVDLTFLIIPAVFAAYATLVLGERRRPAGHHAAARASQSAPIWVVALGAVALVAGVGLTAIGSHATLGTPDTSVSAFFSGWHNPNTPITQVADAMDAAHIHDAYGDYWTAYTLDELDPSLSVTPTRFDVVRSKALSAAVAHSSQPAWLFFSPNELTQAKAAFQNPEAGPGVYDESTFLALLARQGIPARVVHLGILDAVIPDRAPNLG